MQSYDLILSEMIDEYIKISGQLPSNTSDMSIKLKILASQIFSLHFKLQWIKNQVFPQTATGTYLEYHAQTRGLNRKKSCPSTGIVTFSITTPVDFDIVIPVGIICFCVNNPENKFITTSDGKISIGKTNIDIPAKAMNDGLIGNIPSGTISHIVNPPKHIEKVNNTNNFLGGCDVESDEELRKRLLKNFENISNGCNTSYYYNLAMDYDGISSVNVLPRNRGRGTVDIIIASKSPGKDNELVKTIQTEIQQKKEINVDVAVSVAKRKSIEISIKVDIDNSFIFESIVTAISETIKQFFSSLNISDPFRLVALGSEIFKIPGIKNYSFVSPSKDIFVAKDELLVLENVSISKLN